MISPAMHFGMRIDNNSDYTAGTQEIGGKTLTEWQEALKQAGHQEGDAIFVAQEKYAFHNDEQGAKGLVKGVVRGEQQYDRAFAVNGNTVIRWESAVSPNLPQKAIFQLEA